MKNRDTRRWYDRAACIDDDPDNYDTPRKISRAWQGGSAEKMRAGLDTVSTVSRCDTCPVIRECARDALECQDYSTIRAGIPVPDSTSQAPRSLLTRSRAALLLVAGGATPAAARGVLLNEAACRPNSGGAAK